MNIMDETTAKITLHIEGMTWQQVRDMIEDRFGALMWDHKSTAHPADGVVLRMAFAEPASAVAHRAVGKAAPQRAAPADEGGEEWERLAWHLCAEEHGEDACGELLWEGGPTPEPWGERWMRYEGEARRMIALVREHAAAPQQEVREHDETLADFQDGQWWINELDAMASHPIDHTIRVTPDLRRAVAVVHNLLRVVAQQAAPAEPAAIVKWQSGGLVAHLVGDVEAGDLLYKTAPTAQPAPSGDAAPQQAAQEPFQPDWANYRQGLSDGIAEVRKQDAALIRQMLEALVWECGSEPSLYVEPTSEAIAAARAWLEGKG